MISNELGVISVVFETRPDGGLRVYSDDVPGFVLSHPDQSAVLKDVKPALETIIGEIVGFTVTVSAVDGRKSLPWDTSRESRNYEARRAA